MTAAVPEFGYALVVAWFAPAALVRLTARGSSARLGLTTWLLAMASVVGCAVAAVCSLAGAAVAGWPGLAAVVCRSVAGKACAPAVYRGALFESGLGVAAAVAAVTAVAVAWRYGRRLQRAQRGARAHAEAARITGQRLPGTGAVVLASPERAVYCVPGRPAAIVVTSGALAVLGPPQLDAVLAHERAHLAGRHHLLIALTRGLAAVFPGVPLFTEGDAIVARLAEMSADDSAARVGGQRSLVAAMQAMGPPTAAHTAALTSGAVAARGRRLLEPPRRHWRLANRLALLTVIVLLAAMPAFVAVGGAALAAHAAALV